MTRIPILLFALLSLVFVASVSNAFQGASDIAPDKLTFTAKNGNVAFEHKKHTDRVKGKCESCHPKPFARSKAPLDFKAAMHKTAEAKKSSCATCHVEGGMAFASKGSCAKCHVKGGKS